MSGPSPKNLHLFAKPPGWPTATDFHRPSDARELGELMDSMPIALRPHAWIEYLGSRRWVATAESHPAGGYVLNTLCGCRIRADRGNTIHLAP